VRKHCVHGVDALLSDFGDDLVEDFERVWARSVGERCEVAEFGTVEYVLIDDESVAVLFLVAGSTYLETAVDSKHGKSKGAGLSRLIYASLLENDVNTASPKSPNTMRVGWPEGNVHQLWEERMCLRSHQQDPARRSHTISPWPNVRADSEEITNHEFVELLEKFVVQLEGLLDRLDDEIVGD
jgi:hypothetical protein